MRERAPSEGPGTRRRSVNASWPNAAIALALLLCPNSRRLQACPNFKRHRLSASGSLAGLGHQCLGRLALQPMSGQSWGLEGHRNSGSTQAVQGKSLPLPTWPAREPSLTAAKPHSHGGRNPNMETPLTQQCRHEKRCQQWPWLSPPARRRHSGDCSRERDKGRETARKMPPPGTISLRSKQPGKYH